MRWLFGWRKRRRVPQEPRYGQLVHLVYPAGKPTGECAAITRVIGTDSETGLICVDTVTGRMLIVRAPQYDATVRSALPWAGAHWLEVPEGMAKNWGRQNSYVTSG